MGLEYKEIKKNEDDKENNKNDEHYILRLKKYLDSHFEVRFNALTTVVEIRAVDETNFTALDERKINSIWIKASVDSYKCSPSLIMTILNSDLTQYYHPLENYFNNLQKHDGHDYIQDLADTIEISDLTSNGIRLRELWKPFLQKWLVACVATALGYKPNHTCLILTGAQGKGKTTWLNNLCPEELKDLLVSSHITPSLADQATNNYLAEKFLINIDDQLEILLGKEFSSMKAILTVSFVSNRKAYHRNAKTRPRIGNFMGSVNSPRFLNDVENRRYLVFTASNIKRDYNININKVWAQACHLLKTGFKYWFNEAETDQLNEINEIYIQRSIEEEWLQKIFEPCEETHPRAKFLMPSEILTTLKTWSQMRLSSKKLAIAMERLKYGQPISKRIDGRSPRRVYSVLEYSHESEETLQNAIKRDIKNKNTPVLPIQKQMKL